MPIPPSYADLGKAARDIFSKGYNHGVWKLDAKAKTNSGVNFTTSGVANTDTGKVFGSLETKYNWNEYGITFLEKWNTDNVLTSEITIEDQLVKGLKLAFDTSFQPATGKKSGKVKTAYKRDYINTNLDVDFDFAGPTVHAAAVLGYNGWLAGYNLSFDTSKSQLTSNNFAVGYDGGDFVLHTSVNDGTEFGGTVYHKVSKDLETGVNLSWTAGSNATRFGLGAKYALGQDTTVRAKISNNSQLGLSLTQKIKDGLSFNLSALVDCKNFNVGGHKVGLGLDLGE